MPDTPLSLAHQQHDRHWKSSLYCYPVVSRRSGGLSIGINLNPDKACNFDCIYCQVDRTTPPVVRKVALPVVRAELERLLDLALNGALFDEPPFDALPTDRRVVRDIAFSGDGEPTTYPRFEEAVQIAVDAKRTRALDDTKLVLITDACYLTRPNVRSALRLFDTNNGEIWAKLDAGTDAYYRMVCRPNYPLQHVLENIREAACVRPIVIQSLWMRVHGSPPPDAEVFAFTERLREIIAAGGQFRLIQVYTIARQTTEAYAAALTRTELDQVAARVRDRLDVPVESFYGVSG